MNTFNYTSEAELFPALGKRGKPKAVRYRRFATAAEAVRFVIEDMPHGLSLGAVLEVAETRFDSREIRRLYDSPDYPLRRRAAA